MAENGTPSNGPSRDPSISADGRIVAFTSMADNLKPGTGPLYQDNVYVRDLRTGALTKVTAHGESAPAGIRTYEPALSADGRYLAFVSSWIDYVPGRRGPDRRGDVYVRDLRTGRTEKINVGLDDKDLDGFQPSVSADGRYVAFTSGHANLNGDGSEAIGRWRIYVRDRWSGTTRRVIDPPPGYGAARHPAISADGRRIAFWANNATVSGPGQGSGAFVWDRATARSEQLDVPYEGRLYDHNAGRPAISADGRHVVFSSSALVNTTCPKTDRPGTYTYIRDLTRRVTSCLGTGMSAARLTGDGRYLAYDSPDALHLRDLRTGRTVTGAFSADGKPLTSQDFAVDAHGRHVVFVSYAAGVVPGHRGGRGDVFVSHVRH
ncbi:TolB family protein [Streptomyces sp. URMC 127]|uniref:TolB family protein n=1 Tax=Streptomyces sp. URMC 127 TaxID=3423402 RepID=UPI003F19B962